MMDIDQNMQSDYQDAMEEIKQTEEYQDQIQLQRDKDANDRLRDIEKNQIEREKIQAQREMKDKDLQIARENKNQYDKKSSDKKEK